MFIEKLKLIFIFCSYVHCNDVHIDIDDAKQNLVRLVGDPNVNYPRNTKWWRIEWTQFHFVLIFYKRRIEFIRVFSVIMEYVVQSSPFMALENGIFYILFGCIKILPTPHYGFEIMFG